MVAVVEGSSRRARWSPLATLDTLLFCFAGLAALWLAGLLLRDGLRLGRDALLLLTFWPLVAYLLLPRFHRILTGVYLPDYFIGRARTSDGLLGDPVNLALLGSEEQVHQAMAAAGWTRADDLTLRSGLAIVSSTLARRSYPGAPVSPLQLFDRQQDFAYQQEIAGSPSRRHHVRFWKCPEGWMLPGGFAVDWVAAGSYDRSVGLSTFTLQITHRIAADIDAERDHILGTVTSAEPGVRVDVIQNFSTGYHARNGGGDAIATDGHLPVLDVRSLAPDAAPTRSTPVARRTAPPPTVFGAGAAIVKGLVWLVSAAWLLVDPDSLADVTSPNGLSAVVAGVTATVSGLTDIALGLLTWRGRNLPRVVLMVWTAISICLVFGAWARRDDALTIDSGLISVALGILILLALTSRRSRDFALERGHRAHP